MVTNQHFAMSDSHALLTQHVVEPCSAEMWRCWPELGWTEWQKAEQFHPDCLYTCQFSSDNNQWCSAMCCYASPHHNTASKRLTLNDTSVCISFSYTAVNMRTAITAV
jgi:hypothetical protein